MLYTASSALKHSSLVHISKYLHYPPSDWQLAYVSSKGFAVYFSLSDVLTLVSLMGGETLCAKDERCEVLQKYTETVFKHWGST